MNINRKKTFFPYELRQKPGFFLTWFLYRLFKGFQLNENMYEDLKQMNKAGTVIYAMKYRGVLDYLLYHYRFRRIRLPFPKISFDLNISLLLPLSQIIKILRYYIANLFKKGSFPNPFESGFFKNAIQKGTTTLFSLVDPKRFQKHFVHSEKDHIQFLIETQKEMEKPIFIVPLLVIYQKAPEKENPNLFDIFFGYKDKPGLLRKIVLFFRYHRKAFIDFGRPLDLKAYLEGQPADRPMELMALDIRQMLIESIDMQKRIILGPVMKSRQQLKEIVLKDNEIAQTVESMAGGNKKKLKHLKKKAGGYFDEIAGDYNIAYIQFLHWLLRWFWKKTFEEIDLNPKEFAVLRDWARKGPLIYVPSHKSHIDYLALNYMLYIYNMHIPRIAAGKNMAFWPMGHFARKAGAIILRRTFKGARLYAKVFSRYIKALLEEGHPLEFFIEGGRSRSGKLILPKIGFLSILLNAYSEGYCDDLIFVPASISYDRIVEEKSYIKEIGGKKKERESFRQMLRARQFLRRKYGKVYIRFGTPLSLKEYIGETRSLSSETHKNLAFQIIKSINRVTLITPLALVATAILTQHRKGFHAHELIETAHIILTFLKKYEFPLATTLNDFEETIEGTLSLLNYRKVVGALEDVDGSETFFYVDEEKKAELEYYKNSIIHCFICHAFVAVSLLTGTEEEKSWQDIFYDYRFLKNLFKKEFIYEEKNTSHEELDDIISYFTEASFLEKGDEKGGYKPTRLGFDRLPIWANLAKTFLESFWIAAQSFMSLQDGNIKKSDLLKNMRNLGLKFHKTGIISHLEAVSELNFKNAIEFMNTDIWEGHINKATDRDQATEKLSQLVQRTYELSHFIS